MLVPNESVAVIVSRKQSKLKELINVSGVKVQVSPKNSADLAITNERVLRITGETVEQCTHFTDLMLNIITTHGSQYLIKDHRYHESSKLSGNRERSSTEASKKR